MSRLETVLESLPEAMAWPEPSDHLAARVTARIESGARPDRRVAWRWALAAAIALVLVTGLVPGTRQAVADLFREAGVLIGFVEETPAVEDYELDLGEPVSIDRAGELVVFELQTPQALGSPQQVFADDGLISMVWDGPVLLTQRSGNEPFAEKGVAPETQVTNVVVAGSPGIWIEGAEHSFTLLDPDGDPVRETSRLAANVLLWSVNGVDYRLELTDDLQRALQIAGSMEPGG